MAVFQNYMDCVEDGTGFCTETCIKRDVDGTEEIIIKQETVYIKEEIPEAIDSPSIETEHEVRLQGQWLRWSRG
jgi:hypothetical protein